MPVYVRKHQTLTPATFGELSEDEDDFIRDPDQIKDILPQPYRMINKLLLHVYDDIWEYISNREDKRVEESKKIKAAKMDCGIQMQLYGRTSAMCTTEDEAFVFVGLPDGLAVIDGSTQASVYHWEAEHVEVTSVHVSHMKDDTHLVSTVDDMGVARLFFFHIDRLYLYQVLNEKGEGNKTIATKCESAMTADYVALAMENPSSKEAWLEVYKLQKEVLLKEVAGLVDKISKQSAKAQTPTPQPEGDVAIEYSAPDSMAAGAVMKDDDRQSTGGERSQSPGGSSRAGNSPSANAADIPQYKFTRCEVFIKIKQPSPLAGIPCSSVYSAYKTVDAGDVIGIGTNHTLTPHHLEQRDNVFQLLHESQLRLLDRHQATSKQATMIPTFHLLSPGRMLPLGLDNTDSTSSIAVWWSGGTQVFHYSLLKASKELERRPDMVWPCVGDIVASCVSPDTSLIALALDNGNVSVWDKYMGTVRKVQHVTDTSRISRVQFLSPSICPQDDDQYPPYKTRSAAFLLVNCADGSICYINCGMNDNSPVVTVPQRETHCESPTSWIQPLKSIPQVVLNVKNDGRVYLQDVLNHNILCEVILPAQYEIAEPWQPTLALACGGQMLYIKGTKSDDDAADATAPGDSNHDNNNESIFAYQLRSFPSLDTYWRQTYDDVPYLVHTTTDKRIDALLAERLAVQALRQTHMQSRWDQLSGELDIIQQIREAAKKRTAMRSVYGESSISRTPLGAMSQA